MSLSKPISMSPCEPLMYLLNCANKNQTSKPMKNRRRDTDALRFLKAVKVAFQYNMKNYDKFIKILRDFSSKRIQKNSLHISGVKAKVKNLFKGHKYLILEFNKFMPKEHRITLPLETNGKKGEFCQLPWDVLGVISQKLDFEELFQFSGVCKNWRTFHKSNFLSSQELFVAETSLGQPYCFISLPNKKVYNLKKMMMKMMSNSKFTTPLYVGYSSGYFIILEDSYTVLLINPFTRIKKVIYTSSRFEMDRINEYHGLLAFEKCSEEFVLLVLCKRYGPLHVYQSRNNDWVIHFKTGKSRMILDIMVLNNMIYVVTNKANIGVLSLNSAVIKFLKLKNSSNIIESLKRKTTTTKIFSNLNLVTCDGQLLLVALYPSTYCRVVYKIDWLTMSYVELKSLGDIALFHVSKKCCKSLNNPNRWGYESNSVYEVDFRIRKYLMYNWDKDWDRKYFEFPRTRPESLLSLMSIYDWCHNLKYEVDYSLVK